MSVLAYLVLFLALALAATWLKVQSYRTLHPVRRAARVPARRRR